MSRIHPNSSIHASDNVLLAENTKSLRQIAYEHGQIHNKLLKKPEEPYIQPNIGTIPSLLDFYVGYPKQGNFSHSQEIYQTHIVYNLLDSIPDEKLRPELIEHKKVFDYVRRIFSEYYENIRYQ